MSEGTKKPSFFKGVKGEFKKISWPSKDTLTKETIAVLVATVILGVVITVIDLIIRTGFSFVIG